MDLSKENIHYISLEGEWFFAWKKALTPANAKKEKYFLALPSEWNKFGFSPQGYATYSLLLKLPQDSKNLALELPNVASAYRIWLNDTEFQGKGQFSINKQGSKAAYQGNIILLPDSLLQRKEIQITLQISNYEHFRGGIYMPLYIGDKEIIEAKKSSVAALEMFGLGALFFMMTFHFILFFFHSQSQQKEALFLALLCLFIILRTLVINVGSQYWYKLFPDSDFSLVLHIEFITAYAFPFLMINFINAIFPDILSSKALKRLNLVASFLIFTAFLPVSSYLYTLPIFYIFLLIAYFTEFYVCVKAIKYKYPQANTIFIAFLIPFLVSFFESLHHSGILFLPYANISFLGVLFFLFLQSFVISYRIAQAFRKSAYLSKNLEIEVQVRTQELEEQKLQFEKVNENILASIRYAQRIQSGILPSQQRMSKHLKDFFLFYKPRDIVGGDFYWLQKRHNDLYIAAADCTGHGVPGALMAVMGDIALDYAFFRQENQDLATMMHSFDMELLKLINKNASKEDELSRDGIVVTLCKINFEDKKLSYVGANSPMYLIRKGELKEFLPQKYIIGGSNEDEKHFEVQEIDLQENDMLYLFSDGYVDQFGGDKKKKYGTKRFKELLLSISNEPTQEQERIISKEFEEWKRNFSQIDDILLIGIRVDFTNSL
ncbi:MAG: SpoIIE family protein phosphatase [Thermonemataceae bacterium]|nr:SpoIIE family protein phosphatase [Thermonemataceae bacterium]